MPQAQIKLTSEKYWQKSAEQEIRQINARKSRQAVQSFAQFLVALSLIWLVVFNADYFPTIIDKCTQWNSELPRLARLFAG